MSSRAKRRERNQNKLQQLQIKTPEKQEKIPWRWFGLLSPNGKIAATIALFLTVVGSYYTFSLKLTIEPKESLDPSNPFATPFIIRNDSLLGVYSINLKTGIREVYAKGSNNKFSNFGTMTDMPPIPKLDPGEPTTFFITFPFKTPSPITSADIEIMVSYRPVLLPFNRNKSLRFVTMQAKDGSLHGSVSNRVGDSTS